MKNKSNNIMAIIAISFVAIVMLVMVINTISLIKPMNLKNLTTENLESSNFKVQKGLFSYKYTITISGYDKPIYILTTGKDSQIESILKDDKKFTAVLTSSKFKKLGSKTVAICDLVEFSKVQNSANIGLNFNEQNKNCFLRLIFFGTLFFSLALAVVAIISNFVREE